MKHSVLKWSFVTDVSWVRRDVCEIGTEYVILLRFDDSLVLIFQLGDNDSLSRISMMKC